MKIAKIARLLPEVIQRTRDESVLLNGLLGVMESLHEPSERVLENLDVFFDPYCCEERFVPLLASWFDFERFMTITASGQMSHNLVSDLGCLRELVAQGSRIAQWRGTARGLKQCLEIITGCSGFQIDEYPRDSEERLLPFHVVVNAPAVSKQFQSLIEQVIEQEKPIHLTHELDFE